MFSKTSKKAEPIGIKASLMAINTLWSEGVRIRPKSVQNLGTISFGLVACDGRTGQNAGPLGKLVPSVPRISRDIKKLLDSLVTYTKTSPRYTSTLLWPLGLNAPLKGCINTQHALYVGAVF